MFYFIITAALVIFFWPSILVWMSKTLIPWVKSKLGVTFSDYLCTITEWLDKKVRGIRRGFKAAWRFFKERVLRMHTKVEMDKNGNFTITKENYIQMSNGKIAVITTTRMVDMDDKSVTPAMRREIISQRADADGKRTGTIDDKKVIEEKAKERLEEDKKLANNQEEENELREMGMLIN